MKQVAVKTEAANEQHYEVPTDFFVAHLGPCRKYSSCEWEKGMSAADPEHFRLAETNTLDSYCEKMQLPQLLENYKYEHEA